MAKGKESSKPSTLSEEYIQESSEDEVEEVQETNSHLEASKRTTNGESTHNGDRQDSGDDTSPAGTEDEQSHSEIDDDRNESLEPIESLVKPSSTNPNSAKRKADSTAKASAHPAKKAKVAEPSIPVRKSKAASASNGQPQPLSVPAKPFAPPAEFSEVGLSDDAPDFGALLNTDGVQVWHITAPDTVPLSSIKKLDLQAAMQGKPIHKHDGISYSLDSVPATDCQVLLPRKAKKDTRNVLYSKAKVPISQSLQLREVSKTETEHERPNVPNGESERPASQSEGREAAKAKVESIFTAKVTGENPPPRQQPEGLRMRYMPYGSEAHRKLSRPATRDIDGVEDDSVTPSPKRGSKTTEGNDAEMKHAPANSADDEDTMVIDGIRSPMTPKPTLPETPRSWKKQKRTSTNTEAPQSVTTKQHQIEPREDEGDKDDAGDLMDIDDVDMAENTKPTSEKKKKKKLKDSTAMIEDDTNGVGGNESPTLPKSYQKPEPLSTGHNTADPEVPKSARRGRKKKSRVGDEAV